MYSLIIVEMLQIILLQFFYSDCFIEIWLTKQALVFVVVLYPCCLYCVVVLYCMINGFWLLLLLFFISFAPLALPLPLLLLVALVVVVDGVFVVVVVVAVEFLQQLAARRRLCRLFHVHLTLFFAWWNIFD